MSLPINILLVDDNPGDVRLIQEAFKEIQTKIILQTAKDGQEALDMMYKKGDFTNLITPQLIILDLNLPKVDGKDFLRQIKVDQDLKKIPVIVLTTSSSPGDINDMYQLMANCYLTKPFDFDEFLEMIKSLEQFWFKLAQLPSIE